MSANTPDVQALLAQNEELRARLEEAEDALRAIRAGEVDALVMESAGGPQIFTLQGLDAQSNRFRGELLAQVSDAVIVVDDEQRLIYLNASAERQYGVLASEVVGLPVSRMYETRWRQREDEEAALAALRESGHWRGELIHVTHGGSALQVEASVTRLDEANGTGPGLLSVIRDITAEHGLRAIAQQQQTLLKQSEARLKRVLDQLFVFVGILDLKGRLLECNAAPLQRARTKSSDVIGKPFWESYWFRHDRAVMQQLREAARRAAEGETVRFDVRCRFAGGELLTLDLQLAPLRDDAGRITNLIASGVDVEARVRALHELERSEARAVESARRLDAEHRTLEATLNAALPRRSRSAPSPASPRRRSGRGGSRR
jgi:PAS domain S-box-containing protein